MKKILIIDFGGQFAQLIATRIRHMGIYTDICAPKDALSRIDENIQGIVFSGGPSSVYKENAPSIDKKIFDLNIPILGICYGHQLICHLFGGGVKKADTSEYGKSIFSIEKPLGIFADFPEKSVMWMSHGDEVQSIPEGFEITGRTEDGEVASLANLDKKIFSVQFHPEVSHSEHGNQFLQNFINFCGIEKNWSMDNFIDDIIAEVQEQVGDKNVFLMVSGGVDSSVVFALLNKALGQERVFGLFVDTGLLRYNERERVQKMLSEGGFSNLHTAKESERFLSRLKGIYAPEKKREIIGNTFLDVQTDVSAELGLNPAEWFLAQGTIFPDTIESGGSSHSVKIKTHHNRVARIEKLIKEGKLVEPVKMLFKDEVREVGHLLGLPDEMIQRQPFPGPGLGVRVLCAEKEDQEEKSLEIEKEITEKYSINCEILPIRSVGVQGDARTFAHPLVIYSKDFNREKLNSLATDIPNRYKEINRVIFCLSHAEKPDLKLTPSYITKERVDILQKADFVAEKIMFEEELEKQIWQFPVISIPLGKNSIVLRPIESENAMTAVSAHIEEKVLRRFSKEIMEIEGISAVFYDLTSKPPGTIEWE